MMLQHGNSTLGSETSHLPTTHHATPQQPWQTQVGQHSTTPHTNSEFHIQKTRHLPSPKKPAFSRDTTVKDLDQRSAVTLFSQRGGIQEQAHLHPQRRCQSLDLGDARA